MSVHPTQSSRSQGDIFYPKAAPAFSHHGPHMQEYGAQKSALPHQPHSRVRGQDQRPKPWPAPFLGLRCPGQLWCGDSLTRARGRHTAQAGHCRQAGKQAGRRFRLAMLTLSLGPLQWVSSHSTPLGTRLHARDCMQLATGEKSTA